MLAARRQLPDAPKLAASCMSILDDTTSVPNSRHPVDRFMVWDAPPARDQPTPPLAFVQSPEPQLREVCTTADSDRVPGGISSRATDDIARRCCRVDRREERQIALQPPGVNPHKA